MSHISMKMRKSCTSSVPYTSEKMNELNGSNSSKLSFRIQEVRSEVVSASVDTRGHRRRLGSRQTRGEWHWQACSQGGQTRTSRANRAGRQASFCAGDARRAGRSRGGRAAWRTVRRERGESVLSGRRELAEHDVAASGGGPRLVRRGRWWPSAQGGACSLSLDPPLEGGRWPPVQGGERCLLDRCSVESVSDKARHATDCAAHVRVPR